VDDLPLAPVNLASVGLGRVVRDSADLITIWKTPYPVLTNYKKLCRRLNWRPFSGGTHKCQGLSGQAGYITSGYRDKGGNINSAHKFALAIDVAIGDIEAQVKISRVAVKYFIRIGLYPENGFIHLDLANRLWMKKYGGRRFWVRKNGIYTCFDEMEEMIGFARRDFSKNKSVSES
jgi:hypothetical protein